METPEARGNTTLVNVYKGQRFQTIKHIHTVISISISMSNVDLYSAFSLKNSNALNTLVLRKYKHLQWLPVTVLRNIRIPHVLGQRVPDSRARNGRSQTSIGTEPVPWNRDFMTHRPQATTTLAQALSLPV